MEFVLARNTIVLAFDDIVPVKGDVFLYL